MHPMHNTIRLVPIPHPKTGKSTPGNLAPNKAKTAV